MDVGTRSVQLPKTAAGLGMTLRNNPHRVGAVVWTVEAGKAADVAGLRVGDVVLSVEDHLLESIERLVEFVAEAREHVHMEVAGVGPSKQIALVKARDKPVGLGLQVTSCGIGTLVTEIDAHGSAAQSGAPRDAPLRRRPAMPPCPTPPPPAPTLSAAARRACSDEGRRHNPLHRQRGPHLAQARRAARHAGRVHRQRRRGRPRARRARRLLVRACAVSEETKRRLGRSRHAEAPCQHASCDQGVACSRVGASIFIMCDLHILGQKSGRVGKKGAPVPCIPPLETARSP